MPYTLITVLMLIASNVFMTFAWYAHLKNLNHKSWVIAAFISWGIALFEYLLQVPANRIGAHQAGLNIAQLKITQEVITLAVFAPFAVWYMKFKLDWNFFAAGLCMIAAVIFIMRSKPQDLSSNNSSLVDGNVSGRGGVDHEPRDFTLDAQQNDGHERTE